MGTFYVDAVENHVQRDKSAVVAKLLVDTGSEHTGFPQTRWRVLAPEKRGIRFVMANGETLTRDIGFVVLYVDKTLTIDEVVFAQKATCTAGCEIAGGLNLRVDPGIKKLRRWADPGSERHLLSSLKIGVPVEIP